MDKDMTFVPIERDEASAAPQISGEEYYRERGEQDRIQDVEILEETSLHDIEEALSEDEMLEQFEEEFRESLGEDSGESDHEEYEEFDLSDEDGQEETGDGKELNLDGLDIKEADSIEEAVEAIRKKDRFAFRKWYQKWWIYAIVAGVLFLAGICFYWVSRAEYNEKMDGIADDVARITSQLHNGSQDEENTLEEELAFYTDLTHQAQDEEKLYQQTNRTYWWSVPQRSRDAVGLVTLQETMNELGPMLNNLSVFMEQVSQVKREVEGTQQEPGHLRRALNLEESDGILAQDQSMIASTLEMCDGLADLPEAFTAGRENLREELTELDSKVALTREYLIEIRKQAPEVELFCASARDFYQRDFTGHFAEDLNMAYSVLERVDIIQEEIGKINQQEKFKPILHFYGISDFALDDAGTRMLADRGMLDAARTEVQSIQEENADLLANPTDGGKFETALDANQGHYDTLQQLETPKEMEEGKVMYLNGLDVREHYLRAQLEYIAALDTQNAELDKLDELREQNNRLKEEISLAARSGDIETIIQKSQEAKDVEAKIAAQREVCKTAEENVAPKREQANTLYQQYVSLSG